ncbi:MULTISPECIES: nitrite reductase [Bacillus cereus group]|uniref:nitrite reductase n=1 Tax=Bacillus cereus group TaxID=86661 RepID=UPI000BEBA004|nr:MULTISPECIES: nitrite reductase [Bacillus cereus group]PEF50496.1 nitrite reductase [Bacillus thuringiensis]PFO91808.1 nitrite reductase [Bacillus cereus]
MNTEEKLIKLAINGGISFGAKLNSKQLLTIAKYLNDGDELELTTFQLLYIEIPESKVEQAKEEFRGVGLSCYPVGNFVKSLRTCNFCKGAEEEGMPVAIELNKRIAGKPVPFTLRPAYTGCPVGYDLYIGGKAKGKDAQKGVLFMQQLMPKQLYEAVEKIIDIYTEQGKKRESFSKFINRFGLDNLRNQIVG